MRDWEILWQSVNDLTVITIETISNAFVYNFLQHQEPQQIYNCENYHSLKSKLEGKKKNRSFIMQRQRQYCITCQLRNPKISKTGGTPKFRWTCWWATNMYSIYFSVHQQICLLLNKWQHLVFSNWFGWEVCSNFLHYFPGHVLFLCILIRTKWQICIKGPENSFYSAQIPHWWVMIWNWK